MSVGTLTIHGRLEWDDTKDGLELRASFVLVEQGGTLAIGTPERPMLGRATIHVEKGPFSHPELGERFVGSLGDAEIRIHGRPLNRTWTLLARTANSGEDQIWVKHDPAAMGWRVGDRIGIATTQKGISEEIRIRAIGEPTLYQLGVVAAEAGIEESIDGPAPATNTFDGSEMTFWGSWCAGLCTGSEHWISFDLGGPSMVAAMRIRFDVFRYAPVYSIQVRNDTASMWETALMVNDGIGGWTNLDIGRPARYVRIDAPWEGLLLRPNGDAYAGVRIREVEFFGRELDKHYPAVLHLEQPIRHQHWGGFRTVQGLELEMAAEVVNLDRSVLITGDHDDFEETRVGLHTIMAGEGLMDIRFTRVEFCGQHGRMGRYCMHFHHGRDCPECVFQSNAVVESAQIGITVHDTHNALVESNIMWDTQAAGIYVEDGNEMNNTISRNVIICSEAGPWSKCTVAWHANDRIESAGIYMIGMTNHVIENRVVGWENGIWTHGSKKPFGQGLAVGKVCTQHLPFGIFRGNVMHDCNRFGIYLDNQRPRNVRRDANGYVVDLADCEEFTADGADNGIVPANLIEDEFDWHNAFVGHYDVGDISFVRLVSANNDNMMYWKASKNFADGRSWHLRDSVFANHPGDRGKLELRGPSGPFTFLMKNVSFVGGPVGEAAINAGQHCGRLGAGGPCNVQYLLQEVNFSAMPFGRKINFGIDGADKLNTGEVFPVFLATDDSLGGYRSMVSRHLNGFAGVSGCTPAGDEWDSAFGCTQAVRRLSIWTRSDLGALQLSGPGYDVPADMSQPVLGMNAGRLWYESMHRGYAAVVLANESYNLSGRWTGQEALELSDVRAEELLLAAADMGLVSLPGEAGAAAIRISLGADGADASDGESDTTSCELSSVGWKRSFIGPFGIGKGAPAQPPCLRAALDAVAGSTSTTGGSTSTTGGAEPETSSTTAPMTGETYRSIKDSEGLCLSAPDGATNGGDIALRICEVGDLGQEWSYDTARQLRSGAGVCLDSPDRGSDGGLVHVWACAEGNVNQEWLLDDGVDGLGGGGLIKSATGICISATAGHSDVVMRPCNESDPLQLFVAEGGAADESTSPASSTLPDEPSTTTASVSQTETTPGPTTTMDATTPEIEVLPSGLLWILGVGGMCLTTTEPAQNGEDMRLAGCGDINTLQAWEYDIDTRLLKTTADLCLDAPATQVENGLVHVWKCVATNTNQHWDIDVSLGRITSAATGLCLQAEHLARSAGIGVFVRNCSGAQGPLYEGQRWAFKLAPEIVLTTTTPPPPTTTTTTTSPLPSTTVTTTTVLPSTTTTVPLGEADVYLVNDEGLCLEAEVPTENGAAVHATECSEEVEEQLWRYDPETRLLRSSAGLCLDSPQKLLDGGLVHLWKCYPSLSNQHWLLHGDGGSLLKSAAGSCIQADASSIGRVRMRVCDDELSGQRWTPSVALASTSPAPGPTPSPAPPPAPALPQGPVLVRSSRGSCLACIGAGRKNGDPLDLRPCDAEDPEQLWLRERDAALGTMVLRTSLGRCLDTPQGFRNGGLVHVWRCFSGFANQQWSFDGSTGRVTHRLGGCLRAWDTLEAETPTSTQMWACNPMDYDQVWAIGEAPMPPSPPLDETSESPA